MLRKGLASEVRRFLVFFFAIVFAGISIDYGREAAILALSLYVLFTFRNLAQLEHWVHVKRMGKKPKDILYGPWGEITEDIKLITKRYKKDKQRLQTVVTRVQDMTSALHDGVILADKRGNIEWWNLAAKRLISLRDIDLGHRITNILRHPRFQQYFDNGNYSEPLELGSTFNEGQRLLFQVHPFGRGEKLIVVRDITRVSKLEQMRRDFVANVSHELRTPLTVIRGYVETLIDMPNLPPILDKALEQMEQQGLRMSSLVNDLILLTKLETDDRSSLNQSINMHDMVNTIFGDGRALSTHPFVFQNQVTKDLCLLGNDQELRSALSNLILNAVKYSANENKPETTIRVYAEEVNDQINIHIEDNGIGIDPKHIPRLTERFYRIDSGRNSAVGGTGLGLAIVKHVLIRHDGHLSITASPGKGSTFTCSFPKERLIDAAKTA